MVVRITDKEETRQEQLTRVKAKLEHYLILYRAGEFTKSQTAQHILNYLMVKDI